MYQYKIVNIKSDTFADELNEHCKKGFKLFQMMGQNTEDGTIVCLLEIFVPDTGEESKRKDPMACT